MSWQGKSAPAEELAQHGLASNRDVGYWLALIMGAGLSLFVLPWVLLIPSELAQGNYEILAILPLLVVGSGLLVWGWMLRRRYLLIGPTRLFLDPLPGQVGGQIGGSFQLSHGSWVGPPQIWLNCVYVYSTGTGKQRQTRRDVLWQSEQIAWVRPQGMKTENRFVFDVPQNLPTNGRHPTRVGRVEWVVHCEGRWRPPAGSAANNGKSVKFVRDWSIPVEQGSAQSSLARPAILQQAEQQQARAHIDAYLSPGQVSGQYQLNSKAGRIPALGLALLLFGTVFSAAGGFMLFLALDGEPMLWVVGPVFLLPGLMTVMTGIMFLGRSLKVEISRQQIRIVRYLFGMPLYRRQAVLDTNSRLEIRCRLSSTGNRPVSTEYYTAYVVAGDKRLPVAEGIVGQSAAEALCREVGRSTGLVF
ncbi:hypothetical protein [Pseudomonas jilinensis]|uniref:DUF3592 domain-containing protein n=1 Tax=Pseudomonas jilinensis TaxID=2078689 RepID=A0A396S4B2_9PSED|nr:hypothetical protein [Pseudomonas jilinensis]RHW22543.1 hypothetical protein C2846_02625 [Pseudomonas jilinensis]